MWNLYTMEYYSVSKKKKKQNNAICSNMDGRRVVILSEVRQRKTNIMQHHFICGIKKMVQVNLFI